MALSKNKNDAKPIGWRQAISKTKILLLLKLLVPSLFLTSACAAQSREVSRVVTVKNPITVQLPPEPQVLGAYPRLIVPVIGYSPSSTGPVSSVVVLHCQNEDREIGRFGIFPDMPFTPHEPNKQQNFGFMLPTDPACKNAKSFRVSLDPTIGDGTGASMTLGTPRIE